MKTSVQPYGCGVAPLDYDSVFRFARTSLGVPESADLAIVPLRGGLETCGTARATFTWMGASGHRASVAFVVKPLSSTAERELAVYRTLQGTPASGALPQLLGWNAAESGERYMYLEYVRALQRWPWRDAAYSEAMLRKLALVHSLPVQPLGQAIPHWDYESALIDSACETVEMFGSAASAGAVPGSRPMLRALERLVAYLPAIRVALQSAHPAALLHGDAHAGNAIVRRAGEQPQVVLLDWGRARFGSPLEDVCSWLSSLGYWELEIRRRHDTLFRRYLEARGLPDRLTPELRNLYWFAASCNAMSGALRYHLAVVNDPSRSPRQRFSSAGAVVDWLRIIRRADVCWRN